MRDTILESLMKALSAFQGDLQVEREEGAIVRLCFTLLPAPDSVGPEREKWFNEYMFLICIFQEMQIQERGFDLCYGGVSGKVELISTARAKRIRTLNAALAK